MKRDSRVIVEEMRKWVTGGQDIDEDQVLVWANEIEKHLERMHWKLVEARHDAQKWRQRVRELEAGQLMEVSDG